jgi:cyclopropane fatty-acyl-phospholipid synthase-like methyltransferase
VAPVGPLDAELRGRSGRVLSLGSGLCMLERYLAVTNPNLEFVGIDLDEAKVALIASTQERSPRVTLRRGDATAIDEPAVYDTVLICDALHHFPAESHARVAQAVAAALVPDGRVIVKDLDVAPRWKYHWNRVHDRLVAGPEPIYCRPIDEMAEVFESAGLVVEAKRRLDHAAANAIHLQTSTRFWKSPTSSPSSESHSSGSLTTVWPTPSATSRRSRTSARRCSSSWSSTPTTRTCARRPSSRWRSAKRRT